MVCATGRCVTPGDLGAGCDAGHPCRGNLYCSSTATCTAKLGPGGSCAGSSDACDLAGQGVACNGFNNTCVAIAVAKGGETCGIVNGTLTVCVNFDACSGATLTQTGTCANPAADGEFCGSANMGHNCVPPASCDRSNLCRLPSATSCN